MTYARKGFDEYADRDLLSSQSVVIERLTQLGLIFTIDIRRTHWKLTDWPASLVPMTASLLITSN